MGVEKAYYATGEARARTRLSRTGGSDQDFDASGAVTGLAAEVGSFITVIERRPFVRGGLRRVAALIALLAALSPALAEVRTIDPSGEVTNGDFGYSSEDTVVYYPDNNTPAPSSLFGRALKWSGLYIWFVMLRDQIQMDTTDYLGLATSFSLRGTLHLVNITAERKAADGCRSVLPSDQLRCQLEQDLLAAGLKNPNSSSGVSLGVDEAHAIRVPDFPRFVSYGMSAGELRAMSQLLQTLAQTNSVSDPECCDTSVADAPLVPPELDTGLLSSVASPSEGPFADPVPPVGPSVEPPIGLVLIPQPSISSRILETSVPASIPELPVPVMLLVGAGALTLFMRKRALLG